ncbi:MAG: glycosyltransferase family 2 protein [Reichenbachiella sp.]
MTISIIVPTFNKGEQLPMLVHCLEQQTVQDFELILFNDGSTDNTKTILENIEKTTFLNIKTIHSSNLGRSKARNLAVTHSTGELLVFFDDDVRPNNISIAEHLDIHQNQPSPIIAGGPAIYDESKFINNFNFFRHQMENSWYSSSNEPVESHSLRINGGNFSIRRKSFDKIGGFDERLTDKEDFKLAYDGFHYHNIRVFSTPKTWVYHDDFRNLCNYIKRGKESRNEEQKLRLLDPSIEIFDPSRFQIETPKNIKFLIAKTIFRRPFVLSLIENLLDLKIVPQNLAFKLYDICITVNVQYLK